MPTRFRVLVLAVALAAAGFAMFPGPMGVGRVLAHAQLITSIPGSGEVVAEAPAELLILFSEPPELAFSQVHLSDESGAEVEHGGLGIDPQDEHGIVVALPDLAEGTYGVTWAVVSAADGHSTTGFFSFGVGDVDLGAPDDHGGHGHQGGAGASVFTGASPTEIAGWVVAKTLGYAGPLLGIGLSLIGFAVLYPARRQLLRRLAVAQGALLIAGGVGSAAQIWLQADSVTGIAGLGAVEFAQGSRIGQLLMARVLSGVLGGAIVLVMVVTLGGRRDAGRMTGIALGIGGVAGLAGTALIAAGSHAAAFASPGPVVAQTIHLISGGTWLSGVVVLASMALASWRRGESLRSGELAPIVSRFSGLALVAIALVGLTGLYATWIHAGWLIPFDDGYRFSLLLKLLLVAAALGIGGLNYLDGARQPERWGGFGRRVTLEASLALAILALTANLSVRAPTTQAAPVAIAPAVSAGETDAGTRLSISPGRPGPNRFGAALATGVGHHSHVELTLQRLDQDTGVSRIALHPESETTDGAGGVTGWAADGGLLPAGSSWDATVVVHGDDGTEVSRQRFAFALDAAQVSEGRSEPPIDPGVLVTMGLIGLGVLGAAYALDGGSPPLTDPRIGRLALLGGGAVAVVAGVLMFFGAPKISG